MMMLASKCQYDDDECLIGFWLYWEANKYIPHQPVSSIQTPESGQRIDWLKKSYVSLVTCHIPTAAVLVAGICEPLGKTLRCCKRFCAIFQARFSS